MCECECVWVCVCVCVCVWERERERERERWQFHDSWVAPLVSEKLEHQTLSPSLFLSPSLSFSLFLPPPPPPSLSLSLTHTKASASRAEDPRFECRLHRNFSGLSHTSDLKIGTPVATLPGAWRYRVSAGTGQPGVSILWLGEMESWICNFYLSVAARKTEQIRPWDTLACCWDVK